MNQEKIKNQGEYLQQISLESPVIESFLEPARAAAVWPQEIVANEVFLNQLKEHQRLNSRLNGVIDRLPQADETLAAAIEQGQITEEQVAELYESLSYLLESTQDYRRLILYLPFEFLPDKDWQPAAENLRQAAGRFRQAYLSAWKGLLSTHDVRANFVDGDVLEVEQRVGDLPRVVKAAHLIPKLVENGLLEIKEVIALLEESADPILKESIADTLPVLADLGYLTEKEMKLMEKSDDQLVSNMARIIVSNLKTKEKQIGAPLKNITLAAVQKELTEEFSRIEAEDYGQITAKREIWLKQKKKQEAIEDFREDIQAAIMANSLADEEMASFLTAEADSASRQVLIEGIRSAIEAVALADFGKAQSLYGRYQETLLTLWNSSDSETKETLAKAFRHFRQLGLIADSQLADLNITMPKLAGPFSENLKSMKEETDEIRNLAAAIESDPELSQLIYPVVLIYGSRLKGYGEQSADIDLAVFVRPEVPLSNQAGLRGLLKVKFTSEKVHGEITEFWLEEKSGRLAVRDFSEPEAIIGESYWAHILFGAAWEGNSEVMRELREKLLVPYLFDSNKEIYGHEARSLYLEEIERDTLQYRLLHKGYERFFPPCGGIQTPQADEIDGESMFWDSGYRQLATRLFASRVFLPKISAPKK